MLGSSCRVAAQAWQAANPDLAWAVPVAEFVLLCLRALGGRVLWVGACACACAHTRAYLICLQQRESLTSEPGIFLRTFHTFDFNRPHHSVVPSEGNGWSHLEPSASLFLRMLAWPRAVNRELLFGDREG